MAYLGNMSGGLILMYYYGYEDVGLTEASGHETDMRAGGVAPRCIICNINAAWSSALVNAPPSPLEVHPVTVCQ